MILLAAALASSPAIPLPASPRGSPPGTPFALGMGGGASFAQAQAPDTAGQVGLSLAWRPSPSFAVELDAHARMPLERPWINRYDGRGRIQSSYEASLPGTALQATAMARAVFSPVSGEVRAGRAVGAFAIDLALGGGIVRTRDDLERLDAVNDPGAIATETQIHPAISGSIGPRLALSARWSVRARFDSTHWIEVFEGIQLQRMSRTFIGAQVVRAL